MSSYTYLNLFMSLTILALAKAQERAPHGLFNENPLVYSPSTYDFFHPEAHDSKSKALCTTSGCSPLPMVAQVEAAQAEENVATIPKKEGNNASAGRIAGIVFGVTSIAFIAMSAYYLVAKRRANMSRGNSVQPDA